MPLLNCDLLLLNLLQICTPKSQSISKAHENSGHTDNQVWEESRESQN